MRHFTIARHRALALVVLVATVTFISTRLHADTGPCGGGVVTLPFTDVSSSSVFFCSIAEAFFSGLTNGTSSTTYSPSALVPREQMAAFVTRTMDQAVRRAGKRAALRQFWTNQGSNCLALTTVGTGPCLAESDGADLWVANGTNGTVSRVRASDGKLLETWTGATTAFGVLVAMGKVFVTSGAMSLLYEIDPTQPPGSVTTVTSLGAGSEAITFDGQHIWTANHASPGSVSIVTLSPLNVTTVTTGFTAPYGLVYDGANIWVTDFGDNKIKKLDSSGNILMSVTVGAGPQFPAFDGTNIWVPNWSGSTISVVRATGALAGTVLATLTGNGLNTPLQTAFDGERILVTNEYGNSVSLWKASDLTPIGTFSTGAETVPYGACSDGVNFWITLASPANKLARF